jgi:hypothetical protein
VHRKFYNFRYLMKSTTIVSTISVLMHIQNK